MKKNAIAIYTLVQSLKGAKIYQVTEPIVVAPCIQAQVMGEPGEYWGIPKNYAQAALTAENRPHPPM